MQKLKEQKGITLIALVITIIVMLILVGATISVSLNGGLFSIAKEATADTEIKRDNELSLSDGTIEVDEKKYASYEDYLNKNYIVEWKEAETKPEGWSENVKAMTDGTNIIPLPNGFEISTKTTEDKISRGLVIKEGENEFVWIPVADSASYTEDSFGPLTGTDYSKNCAYDSQAELDSCYGINYYNYEEDFTYETDKINVENNIKTYGGFYVGRYETTVDGSTIGVQQGKTVLTGAAILNTTNNYEYRWWGLYKAQKDMYANNISVGSLMISSKQWDAIMAFTGYGSVTRAEVTYTTQPDLSGSAYSTDSSQSDVSKNIYDLAGNVSESTLTASSKANRIFRGRLLF